MYTVLVVDDNDLMLRSISRCLQTAGYRAVCAKDGTEALDLAEQSSPDLMLLDISMPGVDGLSVLQDVREDPAWQTLPVIMYSAVQEEHVRRKAELLGAGYLDKGTLDLDQLLSAVQGRLPTEQQTSTSLQPQPGDGSPEPTNGK